MGMRNNLRAWAEHCPITLAQLRNCYHGHSLSLYNNISLISGVGRVSVHVDRVRKSLYYASLWWLSAQDRRLAIASNSRLFQHST